MAIKDFGGVQHCVVPRALTLFAFFIWVVNNGLQLHRCKQEALHYKGNKLFLLLMVRLWDGLTIQGVITSHA